MNPRVKTAIPTDHHTLVITFTNGEMAIYDCSPFLDFGVFQELREISYFKQARVEGGTVVWPHGQDICPDTLYENSKTRPTKIPGSPSISAKRPVSLSIIAALALIIFGLGYSRAIVMLTQNEASGGLLSWSRLFVEPPENEDGIPWPGWEKLGQGVRGELSLDISTGDFSGMSDTIAAEYWWAKMKLVGGMLIAGPLLVAGWVGVFKGRRWGRTILYVYLAVWMSDKILWLMVYKEEGVQWFALAAGMTVLLLSLLNMRSWKAWIEHSPTP